MKEIILTEDQKDKILYMFARGHSRKAISKELGVSEWSVKKLVQHFQSRDFTNILVINLED